jgi:hypothetical protein
LEITTIIFFHKNLILKLKKGKEECRFFDDPALQQSLAVSLLNVLDGPELGSTFSFRLEYVAHTITGVMLSDGQSLIPSAVKSVVKVKVALPPSTFTVLVSRTGVLSLCTPLGSFPPWLMQPVVITAVPVNVPVASNGFYLWQN